VKPSVSYLRKILRYDSRGGALYWKIATSRRCRVGAEAGSKSIATGYIYVSICYKKYPAQVLAWVIKTGKWPTKIIDHKNLVTFDNRWKNLREATHSQNKANTACRANNTSGFKGVSCNKEKNKWQAQIKIDYKNYHLGWHEMPQAAAAVYTAKLKQCFGEFARVR